MNATVIGIVILTLGGMLVISGVWLYAFSLVIRLSVLALLVAALGVALMVTGLLAGLGYIAVPIASGPG